MFEFLFCINIFLFGFLIIFFILRSQNILMTGIIYSWHSVFCILYYYLLEDGADSLKYYDIATTGNVELFPGTPFVVSLAKIIVFFDGGLLSVFLFFNIFGALGLIVFYNILKDLILTNIDKCLMFIIIFLPSISFWSSSLGKDSLSFLSVIFFIFSFHNKRKYFLLIFSLILMFMVRPHIALIMLASLVFFIILGAKFSYILKSILGIFFLIPSYFLLNFVTDYVGLNEQDNLSDYMEQRQNVNLSGGSSIDIQSMSIIEKFFAYMFRPMPYEATSIFSLFISIENLILLLFVVYYLFKVNLKLQLFLNRNCILFLIYFILCLLVLSFTTANVGIAIRQKWMFFPILIYLLLYVSNQFQQKKAS